MDGLEPITLVVKAPNQKMADQTVECSLDWTVKHLKKHLSDIYPSRPLENQQRIIYSGHLLKDESVLKDILKQYEPNQTVHTVHLVCSSPNVEPPSFPKQSEGLRNRRPAAAAASSASSTAEPMRTTASATSSENSSHSTAEASAENAQFISPNTVTLPTGTVDPALYNYYYNMFTNQSAYPASSAPQFSTLPQAPSMGYSSAPFVSPNFAPAQWPTHFPVCVMNIIYAAAAAQQQQGAFGAVPTAAGMFGTVPEAAAASPQWLASIQQQQLIQQQMYTQYFNYFMQYFQAAGSANQPILLPPPSAAEAAAAPEPAAGQPAARPARAAEPQAMRMNAQGGPVIDDEDDEEMNRDWLDWVYTFIRFSMLLCILYFYSSFSRFMTALCLMVVFYVYQAGWVRLPRQERRNVPQQQQQQQQQPEAQQQNPNPNGQEEEGEAEGTEEPARPPAPVEHRPSALSLAWNFFISFFLSLAPQAPPAVNAN